MTIGAPIYYGGSPVQIRDATAALVATVAGIKTVRKGWTLPTKDVDLPLAAVYVAADRTEANGDPNVSNPHFFHRLTIAVSLLVSASSTDVLDGVIVNLAETVRATVLTDIGWNDLVEGVERADVRFAYPKEAGDLLAEAIVEIEVSIRSEWPPYAPNDFLRVDVTTPNGALDGFTTEFDIPQG